MTILRFLGLIILMSTLSSCLPTLYGAYYRPSYPDDAAVLERRDCGRSVGPLSVLNLTAPDGSISVTLSENRQDQLGLGMWLDTSGLFTLQFRSNVIRLSDPEEGTEWTIEAKTLDLDNPFLSGQIPYSRVVDFGNVGQTAPEFILKNLAVSIPFTIDDFSPDVVRLYLPPIIINNDRYVIPPIPLEADKENRKYRKGRWDWWPYKWKEEKIDAFTIAAGGTGGPGVKPKVDDRLKKPQLNGSIRISFPADRKWKFTANEIRFEDADSGDVRRINFTHLHPMFATEVTFTAPFCCTRHASTWIPIGDARPKTLRVEIPPLLINGKEFAIKPITFELRRFDVGILPFNC